MCVCVYNGPQWSNMKFHAAIPTVRSTFHGKQMLVTKAEGMPAAGLGMCDSADSKVWDEEQAFTCPRMLSWLGVKPRAMLCFSQIVRGWNEWNREGILLFTACGFHAFRSDGEKCPVNIQTSFQSMQMSYTSHTNLLICFAKLPSSCRSRLTFEKLWLNMEQCTSVLFVLYSNMSAVCVLYACLLYAWRSCKFQLMYKNVVFVAVFFQPITRHICCAYCAQ